MNETNLSGGVKFSDMIEPIDMTGYGEVIDVPSLKKPWYSWLSGPWLWAWYTGVLIGNLLALATFVSYLLNGNWVAAFLFAPLLWPFWVIITALVLLIPLGVAFTCGAVVVKTTVSAYHALPFTVNRR